MERGLDSPILYYSHLDWIQGDTLYLSVFSPNAGKCGPEILRIRSLFTQWKKKNYINFDLKVSQWMQYNFTFFWKRGKRIGYFSWMDNSGGIGIFFKNRYKQIFFLQLRSMSINSAIHIHSLNSLNYRKHKTYLGRSQTSGIQFLC